MWQSTSGGGEHGGRLALEVLTFWLRHVRAHLTTLSNFALGKGWAGSAGEGWVPND